MIKPSKDEKSMSSLGLMHGIIKGKRDNNGLRRELNYDINQAMKA
jgi:hypothetical protein